MPANQHHNQPQHILVANHSTKGQSLAANGGGGFPYLNLSNKGSAAQQLAEITRFFPTYSTVGVGESLVFSPYPMPSSTLSSSVGGNSSVTSSQTLSSIISSSGINEEEAQETARSSSTSEIDVVSDGSQGGDAIKMTEEKEAPELARKEGKIEEDIQEKGPLALADLIGRNVITGNVRLSDLLRAKAVEDVSSRQVCPFFGVNSNFYLKNIRHSSSVFDSLNRNHQLKDSFSIFAVDTVGGGMSPLVPQNSSSSPAHSQLVLKIETTDLNDNETGENLNAKNRSNLSEELEIGSGIKHSKKSISVASALDGRFKVEYSSSKEDTNEQ